MATSTEAPQALHDTGNPTAPPHFVDDRSPHCVPFILSRLRAYRATLPENSRRPFVVGLNGVQGAGKTTVVAALADTLREKEGLETLVLSIDDLYLKHEDQVELAREQEGNKLVQHRGEPGTHDIPLARSLFSSLLAGRETPIPSYNKALYSGQGDRAPASTFRVVNAPSSAPISVIILEGWLVGFRSLPESAIALKQAGDSLTLNHHDLSHLLFVNSKLKGYDVLTDELDAFIHIDAAETGWVYEWREEQEAELRKRGGGGMTKDEVRRFVDGYYPAYELYVDGVRQGVLKSKGEGRQLRMVVGRDRRVEKVFQI